MSTCDSEFVQPVGDEEAPRVVCPGAHHKFDSCLDEALYYWSLDDSDSSTGDTDFEGHLAVVIVEQEESQTVDEGQPDERQVLVPAGNYLVWTASSGKVTVGQVETLQQAREIFDRHEARYWLWEAGCDPDDLVGHEDCGDSCRKPEWVNR